MTHREIAFRIFNFWKIQQLAFIEGTDLHSQYKFAYRNVMERVLFSIDTKEFSFTKLVEEILDKLPAQNDPYEKGAKKALSDCFLLLGKVPPLYLETTDT
jgi:hypothetical protein